jgi:hypothetical protein
MTYEIIHADVLEALKKMPDASFDGVLTDPPYGLGKHEPTVDEIVAYLTGASSLGPLKKGLKNCANSIVRNSCISHSNDGEPKTSESPITFRITVAHPGVSVGSVQLNNQSTGEQKVDGVRTKLELDDVLMRELDTPLGESSDDRKFCLRERDTFTGCVEECGCFTESGPSAVRVLVRLRHDPLGESKPSSGVVTFPRTELRAILSLELRRRTGELVLADSTHGGDCGLLLTAAQDVGASSGARRLTTVLQAIFSREVLLPADRTFSFDLSLPSDLVRHLQSPRVPQTDFMDKAWELPSVEVWRETMRVLRPGAHVLAFGGSRMFDLLTVGMRAGGFKVRDVLSWMYSTGFPKSLDVSKNIDKAAGAKRKVVGEKTAPDGKPYSARRPNSEGQYMGEESHVAMSGETRHDSRLTAPATPDAERFDGWGTALAPAWEPIVLARKPFDGTITANALVHGTGSLNIDGTRIGYVSSEDREAMSAGVEAIRERGGVMNNSWKNSSDLSGANPANALGRWPKNVVLSHLSECVKAGTKQIRSRGHFNDETGPSRMLSSENGGGMNGTSRPERDMGGPDGLEEVEAWNCPPWCPVAMLDAQSGDRPGMSGGGTHAKDYGGGMFGAIDSPGTARNDNGGASRFFATFPADDPDPFDDAVRFAYVAKASRAEREFGCEKLPAQTAVEAVGREPDSAGAKNPRAGSGRGAGAVRERCGKCGIPVGSANHEGQKAPCTDGGEHEPVVVGRGEPVRNHHVSVKPIALTRWLATLLLPPPLGRPRRLLVLYSGSGSEMIGALRAGWDEVVGIEREPVGPDSHDYVAIARARLERWSQVPAKMTEAEAVGESRAETKKVAKGQESLFK